MGLPATAIGHTCDRGLTGRRRAGRGWGRPRPHETATPASFQCAGARPRVKVCPFRGRPAGHRRMLAGATVERDNQRARNQRRLHCVQRQRSLSAASRMRRTSFSVRSTPTFFLPRGRLIPLGRVVEPLPCARVVTSERVASVPVEAQRGGVPAAGCPPPPRDPVRGEIACCKSRRSHAEDAWLSCSSKLW